MVPKGITVPLGFTKSGVANLQSFPTSVLPAPIMIVFDRFPDSLIVLMLNIVGATRPNTRLSTACT